jgi:copper transport protein
MTRDLPAVALLAADDKTLVGTLMAVDRLVVTTGLLVLLGGAGFLAVARLPTPAWPLTRRVEGRAWWLLRVAWSATLVGTLAGLLLHGPFTAGLSLGRAPDATLLAQTLGTRFGGIWALRVLLLLLLVAFLRVWVQGWLPGCAPAPGWRSGCWRLP